MSKEYTIEQVAAIKSDWDMWYIVEDNPINYKIKTVFEVIMESIEGGSDE